MLESLIISNLDSVAECIPIHKCLNTFGESSNQGIIKKISLIGWTKVFQGGTKGFFAGIIQVISLMWLRTIISYQYKHGVSLVEAVSFLYNEGGLLRFYRGISFALVQTSLSRFGSVAANEIGAALSSKLNSEVLKLFSVSAIGSIFVSLWRIFLMPIDNLKTVLQVDGKRGFDILCSRV